MMVKPDFEAVYDQRAAVVKEILDKHSAALDANTERLRAIRLAQQAVCDAEQPRKPAKSRKAAWAKFEKNRGGKSGAATE